MRALDHDFPQAEGERDKAAAERDETLRLLSLLQHQLLSSTCPCVPLQHSQRFPDDRVHYVGCRRCLPCSCATANTLKVCQTTISPGPPATAAGPGDEPTADAEGSCRPRHVDLPEDAELSELRPSAARALLQLDTHREVLAQVSRRLLLERRARLALSGRPRPQLAMLQAHARVAHDAV